MPKKIVVMSELKLQQMQHEINTWKRMLGFMQEENVHLKNRLSEVLKDRFNKELLDTVEFYQTKFIEEDEMIVLLKTKVSELENTLLNTITSNDNNDALLSKKIEKLRKGIDDAEKKFNSVNNNFNKYLAENI